MPWTNPWPRDDEWMTLAVDLGGICYTSADRTLTHWGKGNPSWGYHFRIVTALTQPRVTFSPFWEPWRVSMLALISMAGDSHMLVDTTW